MFSEPEPTVLQRAAAPFIWVGNTLTGMAGTAVGAVGTAADVVGSTVEKAGSVVGVPAPQPAPSSVFGGRHRRGRRHSKRTFKLKKRGGRKARTVRRH